MVKYYIDTCLWIDFIEGRTTDDILIRIIEDEDVVVYSYPLEKELLKYFNISQIRMIYLLLSSKGLIYLVDVNDIQKYDAHNLSISRNVPFADALHAVLARDNDAILLTRDKHFIMLKDICDIKLF